MDAVHPAVLEAESRSAGREKECRVGAGSAAAALADMGAEREGAPLWRALAQVATGGVEQLRGVPRHGKSACSDCTVYGDAPVLRSRMRW